MRDKYQIIKARGAQQKLKIFNLDEEEMKCDEDQIVDMIIKQNHLDEARKGFHIKILKKIIRKRSENSSTARTKRGDGTLIVEVDNATHVEMSKK